MLRNPHFWINIAITLFIGYIYYDWYSRYEWFWWFSVYEGLNNIVGSLFSIPFVYASILFRFRGALIFWVLAFVIALPRIILLAFSADSLVSSIVMVLVPLMVVGIITLELKWRNRQNIMLKQREQERQLYMTQIFQAQETERKRISLELHDGCMQELIAVANRANDLTFYKKSESTVKVRERASWLRDTVIQVSEELRRISLDLRPSSLDNLGLVSALRWLADRLNRESQINTRVSVKGQVRKLPSETEVTIFRMIQEALNNIRRHSEATDVTVSLKFNPESIRITIKDNGIGFNTKTVLSNLAANGHLGIIAMKQRARSLNGTFTIQSQPGNGTLITIDADIT